MTVVSQNVSAMRNRVKRAGLTLIELIVVLFILAAIAGISLTFLPSFQLLTHGSTSASAIRAGQTSIAINFIRRGQVGDNFDALISTTPAVPDYVAASTGLIPFATDATSQGALNDLGITTLHPAAADTLAAFTGENVTFEGHDYASTIDLTAGTPSIAQLTPAKVTETEFNFNLDLGQYDNIFAFGIGERCSLVGANGSFAEAPVHTPGEGSAATTYGRYVILVGYDATVGEESATYIGLVCIDDGENFNNINRNLGEYLEAGE